MLYSNIKCEILEQCDDRNALLHDDLDNKGGESEQSCKNDNQQQYMIMSTLRRAYPMLRTKLTQAWPPTNTMRIHDNNDQQGIATKIQCGSILKF